MSNATLWIFGYGSLVWRPAFPHLRSCPARIPGHARRFWQGSTDHRGLPERPGRVVTLLPDHHESLERDGSGIDSVCWGTAYEISGDDAEDVLVRLDHRERGGYERVEVEISLYDSPPSGRLRRDPHGEPAHAVAGLVYIAGPENENYLGAAPIEEIARQIVSASGPSGANPEYVFELARSLREMDAEDAHVFAVEAEVARILSKYTQNFR